MSRAFVNEDAAALAGIPSLPDRPVSGARNLVTRRGLGLIEAALARHREALAAAQAAQDRDGTAREERELRYWAARHASAELSEPPPELLAAVFGTLVKVRFDDGREAAYSLVGEDESEPEAGRIAWTAPVARALTGSAVGERRSLPKGEVEVIEITSELS